MNIVFLTARFPPDVAGGGEVSTQVTAEALAAAGARITVLCGSREDRDQTVQGVRILGRRTLLPWWGKPLGEQASSRRLTAVVQRELSRLYLSPDVLHAQEFRSALTLSQLEHPRRVVTIRDYAPICGTTNNFLWDGSICDGCFWTNVLFRCHRVVEASLPRKPFRVWQYKGNLSFRLRAFRALPVHVYTSEVLRRRVGSRLRLGSAIRTWVIPNPVDPAWLARPPQPMPSQPVLCTVGRLETTKGTEVLLESLVSVRTHFPNVQLHFVGGGEIERYRALGRRLGILESVTFHGAVAPTRIPELIDAAAIVVSPHRWEEPFGRAALEAGARQRPLVASRLGGVQETTNANTALLVPPGDARKLSAALRALLADAAYRTRLGEAARAHIEDHFAASAVAEMLLSVYTGPYPRTASGQQF